MPAKIDGVIPADLTWTVREVEKQFYRLHEDKHERVVMESVIEEFVGAGDDLDKVYDSLIENAGRAVSMAMAVARQQQRNTQPGKTS